MCGKHLKIKCKDNGSGYCRGDGACVVMKVTNACPQYNPCNTCKGNKNQCRTGHNHIDLCDATFNHIAYSNKQPNNGITITVEPTNDPEGDCKHNDIEEEFDGFS